MPGFIHARVKPRILVQLLHGRAVAQIAASEGIGEVIVTEFARSCGWPDRAKVRRWAKHYAARADVDLAALLAAGPDDADEAPQRAPRPRHAKTPSTEALAEQAAAELVDELGMQPAPTPEAAPTPTPPPPSEDAEVRTCEWCAAPFSPAARNQRFCTHLCRESHKRDARREAPRPTTATCEWCREEFTVPAVGRVPKYCRPGHAEMASRTRRKLAATPPAAEAPSIQDHTDMTPPPHEPDPTLAHEDDDPDAPVDNAGGRALYDTDGSLTNTDDSLTATEATDANQGAEAPFPVVDLADVPDLITRALALDRPDTARALVALLTAVTTLRATVTAAETAAAEERARAERIAELTADRERIAAELAAYDAELATLTAPAPTTDPEPQPAVEDATDPATIPHPALAAGAAAAARADVPEASVEHVGVLMVPPTRKGGRWGCGEPGCNRSFPTQRGVLTHAHRVHHQQRQEAS